MDLELFQASDFESQVIGSILLQPDAIEPVSEIITAADFVDPADAETFRTLQAMRADGEPIDTSTLTQRLKERGAFKPVGGAEYLASRIKYVTTASFAPHYAEKVREASARREASGRLSESLKRLSEPTQSVDDAIARTIEDLRATGETTSAISKKIASSYI